MIERKYGWFIAYAAKKGRKMMLDKLPPTLRMAKLAALRAQPLSEDHPNTGDQS